MLPLLAFLPLLSAQPVSKRFTGVLIQSQSSSLCVSVPSSQNSSSPLAGTTIVSADCSGASTWDVSPGAGPVLYAQNSSLAMLITSVEAGSAVVLGDAVTFGGNYTQTCRTGRVLYEYVELTIRSPRWNLTSDGHLALVGGTVCLDQGSNAPVTNPCSANSSSQRSESPSRLDIGPDVCSLTMAGVFSIVQPGSLTSTNTSASASSSGGASSTSVSASASASAGSFSNSASTASSGPSTSISASASASAPVSASGFASASASAAQPSSAAYPTIPFGAVYDDPPGAGQRLHPAGRDDLCVTVANGYPQSGEEVAITYCLSNSDSNTGLQLWSLPTNSSGPVTLHDNDGLCLDAGDNPADGSAVKIWTCYDGLDQQTWTRSATNTLSLSNNQCLDVTADSTTVNEEPYSLLRTLQTWQCSTNGDPQQIFNTLNATKTETEE
ncbi:hypothetical protein JCM24511_06040 [Saitozyma sp. JCM 24511]|nr:hypothetical protein JCM24511_06040 [Saitozyma sp. JCM 24511]